jgi:hypothetical protein
MAGRRVERSLSITESSQPEELEMNAKQSSRKVRRQLATATVTVLAALTVAGPASAALVGGVTNGGCTAGLQVGHITHSDGSITPICQTFG